MINLNTIFISAILTLVVYIFAVIFFGEKKKKVTTKRQKIPLSEIAKLWANSQQTGQLHIKDLAPLWRKSAIKEEERSEYVFRYIGIKNFFIQRIENQPWFDQAEAHQEICYQILRMLEEEDPCSSVVNSSHDVEASWDTNTYSMLGRTTLLDHTLHVAEHTVALLIEAEAHHVIPDAMIAALAHDLGKLPSNRTHLYSLGEHPLAAGRVLAEIELFKKISRKDEITKAIKQHHMRPDGLLGRTLKKADQKARQQEIEDAVAQQPEEEQQVKESAEVETDPQAPKPKQEKQTKKNKKATPQFIASQNGLARQADSDIYGDDDSNQPAARRDTPNAERKINISAWFDAEPFLEELKTYINRIEGRRFMAFSMPNGYVYFQPKVIEELARKQARKDGAMDIATMGEKDKTMQKVLLSIVEQFRNKGLIACDLIKDGYFGGYFTININGGKTTMKGYYTPFLAEAFGSLAEMERKKKGVIKNFSSVELFQGDK